MKHKMSLLLLGVVFSLVTYSQSTLVVTTLNDNNLPGSFRNAIATAQAGDTIRFNPNVLNGSSDTLRLTLGSIPITKSLVIKGVYNGSDSLVISGENNYRVFTSDQLTSADSLILDSVVIANGKAPNGLGGAINHAHGKLLIQNCKIVRNVARFIQVPHRSRGGGIYADSAKVIINKSVVSDNEILSSTSMGTHRYAQGGGMYITNSSLMIKESVVSGNRVDALISRADGLALGGGVYAENCSVSLLSTTVSNNMVNCSTYTHLSGSAYAQGGGLYLSNCSVVIDSSEISRNEAFGEAADHNEVAYTFGGGIYSDSSLVINYSTIRDNKIESPDDVKGGGIYAGKNLTMKQCVIDSNYALAEGDGSAFGGGVFVSSVFMAKQSLIINNRAGSKIRGSGFGGGIFGLTLVDLEYVTISHNVASTEQNPFSSGITNYAQGGGIACNFKINLLNCILNSNQATANTYGITAECRGGAIYSGNGTLNMDSCRVENNTAFAQTNSDARADGGGIYAQYLSITASSINHNLCKVSPFAVSFANGGGIAGPNASNFVLMNSELDSNTVENFGYGNTHGGGVSLNNFSSLFMDGCSVSGNGVHSNRPQAINNLVGGGGVFGNFHSSILLSHSEISHNQSTVIGVGCISIGGGVLSRDSLTVINTAIIGNLSWSNGEAAGGGIGSEIDEDQHFVIQRSTIARNKVHSTHQDAYGGGVYAFNLSSSHSTIASNQVISDSAKAYAGGIYTTDKDWNYTDTTFIINNTIAYNEVSGYISAHGSGMYCDGHYPLVAGSILALNSGAQNLESIRAVTSSAYNIYGDAPIGSSVLDSVNVVDSILQLDSLLQNNGGYAPTYLPLAGSIAIDSGNPQDSSDAQNKPVLGTRDIGAAEVNCKSYNTIKVTSCNAYKWIQTNLTYTTSGLYRDTLINAVNCDSILTLDLSIVPSKYSIDVQQSCDSFTWINGVTYTSDNNTATDTLLSSAGCDSIVTLDLRIVSPDTGTEAISACNSYKWIDGNWYFTSNNSAMHTLTNSKGCDSVVRLDLTIYHDKAVNDSVEHCGDSYTWIDGVTYTSSQNFSHTLQTAGGCDSILSLYLVLNNVDTAISYTDTSISALARNATYQWLDCNAAFAPLPSDTFPDFFPSTNGSYAVQIRQGLCIDTSRCFTVSRIGIREESRPHIVSAFPNPTSGEVEVNLGSVYQNVEIRVISPLGQVLTTNFYRATSSATINLDGPNGLYVVKFTSEDGLNESLQIVKRVEKSW